MRREWGCDAEGDVKANYPNGVVGDAYQTCPICPDSDADPACEICEGEGGWTLRRCPNAYTSHDDRKVVTCASMVDVGLLPVSGGWQDQTAWFQQAASLVLAEKRASEERQRKESMSRGR